MQRKSFQICVAGDGCVQQISLAVSLQRKFPPQVAEHLLKIFAEHGPPNRLQSENGGMIENSKKMSKGIYIYMHIYTI